MKDNLRVTVGVRSGRTHMTIEREDGKPIRVGWDKLQAIKNRTVGEDICMVEYFPPHRGVVYEINRRHFWATEDELPM
jgi:hypothetical protein